MLAQSPGLATADDTGRGKGLTATPAVGAFFQKNAGTIDQKSSSFTTGEMVNEITLANVSKTTGKVVYCVRGGPCSPSEAIRLLGCRVGAAQATSVGALDTLHAIPTPAHAVPIPMTDALALLSMG